MGDVPNQPDLSCLGTQTSISLTQPTFCLSEACRSATGQSEFCGQVGSFPSL